MVEKRKFEAMQKAKSEQQKKDAKERRLECITAGGGFKFLDDSDSDSDSVSLCPAVLSVLRFAC